MIHPVVQHIRQTCPFFRFACSRIAIFLKRVSMVLFQIRCKLHERDGRVHVSPLVASVVLCPSKCLSRDPHS